MAVRRWMLIAAWALGAGAAVCYGGLGSVISSFHVGSQTYTYAESVTCDSQYLYFPFRYDNNSVWFLDTYYPSGAGIRERLIGFSMGTFCDADASMLGDGYFTGIYRCCDASRFYNIRAVDGSVISSWPVSGAVRGYAYFPGSDHYFFSTDSYVFKYLTSGSIVGSFPVLQGHSIAVTNALAGQAGEYILCSGDNNSVMVYSSAGGFMTSFAVPGYIIKNYGITCGPGYPAEAGITLWGIWEWSNRNSNLYQVSLGNGVGVEPASLGRVKAAYR